MIEVYYARIPDEPAPVNYMAYLSLLPGNLQQKNLRFLRWRDRWLNLLGKLLLMEALELFGYGGTCLENIQYDPNGRPYIPGEIDFNISHSGNYVLCAVGNHIRLGVDIEEIQCVEVSDFENVMNKEQWKDILQSDDPYRSFFSYWTIKESVIKADSRGLTLSLEKIHVCSNEAICEGKTWYLTDLPIDRDYCACLASDNMDTIVQIRHKDPFTNL